MIDVILHGANGRMGKVLQEMIAADPQLQVVAGIDKFIDETSPLPQYASPSDCRTKADVIIDFSNHGAVPALLDYCVASKTPVIVATTALTEDCRAQMREAAKTIPLFFSANMSLGINVLMKALKAITPVLEESFNIEIIEKHHNQKLDSPSGTAILLADTINDACEVKKDYIFGRHGKEDECKLTDLGIHAVRGGTIPGEHTVLYAGPDELIELKHTALSRTIFASGAVKAAKFLAGKAPGLYTMEDLV